MRRLQGASTTTIAVARRLILDERGQDLIEYALLSGIIGAAGTLLIPPIVTGMRTSYLAWQTGVRDVWEPCAPGASPCS